MSMNGGKVTLLIAALALAIFAFSSIANAQVYTGVVDGYVVWENGTVISGASVSATVGSGCSGSGCTGSYVSQANGYYVINNLNMISGDSVALIATSGGSTGCVDATAGGGGVAHANITMLPSAPALTPQADTHSQSVSLSWTSGTDPGASTSLYDQYQFDSGGYSTQTSPQAESGLTYSAHTWNVVTCNSVGCTCTAPSDTFSVTNNPPPMPILDTLNNTNESSVLLNWTSGGADPDGDDVHYEYQFGELGTWTTTDNNAVSPKNETVVNAVVYNWRVRACDNTTASNSCSDWAYDDFIVCGGVCEECDGGGGGGGGTSSGATCGVGGGAPSYVASVSAPLYLKPGEEFTIYANFKSGSNVDSVRLSVTGDKALTFKPVTITNLSANTEKTVAINGTVSADAAIKEYTLLFTATSGTDILLSKHFGVNVQELETICGNAVCETGETPETCPADCPLPQVNYWPILIAIIVVAVSIMIVRSAAKNSAKRSKRSVKTKRKK